MMGDQEQQPVLQSIRRKSFVEAYGIPEDGILQLHADTSEKNSITIDDFEKVSDLNLGNSDGSNKSSRKNFNDDSESSFGSSAPNFAGGNVRRRGSRSRRLRAETRHTMAAFSIKNSFKDSVRRSSTGSLEQSFGDMSLQSFTSDSSFTVGNSVTGPAGLQVANLLFVTDLEMAKIMYSENDECEEGGDTDERGEQRQQLMPGRISSGAARSGSSLSASLPPSAILGTGAFSTVRLAWRKTPSQSEGDDDYDPFEGTSNRQQRRSIVRVQSHDTNSCLPEKGQLVAVKMIEKSILKQMKTMQKGADNRLTVRTAFDDIEKEIATMKRLRHPNCVQLFEVIDSVESDKLYMVLEYVSLGEILSNVDGTDRYERKRYRRKVKGLTSAGHFDEEHTALYFVDILHGLAYLHRHSICHRDLKPENILLGMDGIAKISDFGVAHMFDNERTSSWSIPLCADDDDPINEFLSDDEEDVSERTMDEGDSPTHLSKRESDEALFMSAKHSSGLLQKTEGTLYFYAPEMCSLEAKAFSGYAADLWAAGVCLHIFTTGKLPFFALNPTHLFDMITNNDVQYDSLDLSDDLKSLLRKLLTKDPTLRAGVGDCLKHKFCKDARAQRTRTLGKEFQQSAGDIVLTEKEIDLALSVTMISDAFTSTPTARQESESKQAPQPRRRSEGLFKLRESFRLRQDMQTKRPSLLQDLFKTGYFRRSSKKGRFLQKGIFGK